MSRMNDASAFGRGGLYSAHEEDFVDPGIVRTGNLAASGTGNNGPGNNGVETYGADDAVMGQKSRMDDEGEMVGERSVGSGENDQPPFGRRVRRHRALVVVPTASMARKLTFWELFQASMKMRAARRPRTLMEIAQYVQRMLRVRPEWRRKLVSEIDAMDCVEVIEQAFQTASMQRKARMLLHAIFALGVKLGACQSNPLDLVSYICEKENTIRALRIEEVRLLLNAAQQKEHLACAPAVGVMLWAGLRPTEVTRLHWSDLHMDERVIHLRPQHSKTGSVRQVRIHDVLYAWLQRTAPCRSVQTKLVPRGWERRWRELRRSAGFKTWIPDVLRHTFASYHVKYFRNLSELQLEMGHGSAKMLLTRYLGMDHVTAEGAAEFWGYEKIVAGGGETPHL